MNAVAPHALLARMRLFQMASQAFPIGGYSHSQGLEAAIDAGLVQDEASVVRWVTDVLTHSLASYELPVLDAMATGWESGDAPLLARLNEEFLASRESAELRMAAVQMGFSLRTLAAALPLADELKVMLESFEEPSLPLAWSGVASAWSVDRLDSMAGYVWSWAENQVLVAMKSVPIGQSAGQRVLLVMGEHIARFLGNWTSQEKHMRSNFAPGLAMASARHETQYSRLFRS